MIERHRPEFSQYNYAEHDPRIQNSAAIIAEHLSIQQNASILADVDGVMADGGGLHEIKLATPHIIPSLAKLEQQGVAIGPATARGRHIVDFLRSQGLQVNGKGILEGGHLYIHGNDTKYIAMPGHTDFIRDVGTALSGHHAHAKTWKEVKSQAANNRLAFCHGNYQWQGECRSSFWFSYDGPQQRDEEIAQLLFYPTIHGIAKYHGLDPQKDINIKVSRMTVENLAIVGIKGNILGEPVDKARVIQHFMQPPWIFIADGFDDLALARITQEKGGLVVGVKGNLDIDTDVQKFLDRADIIMETPEELAQTLDLAADFLAA